MAATDLAASQALSVSEKRLLQLGLSQLALGAVKVSGTAEKDAARPGDRLWLVAGRMGESTASMAVLNRAHAVVKEVEAALERKPRPYGFEDPSVPGT